MAHLVKCVVCGHQFDRDKIQAVKVSARRYAHYTCNPEGELVPLPTKNADLIALENYIMKLFEEDYVSPQIRKQIKQYHEEYHYSYSGMLKTLIYWFEVKGNSIEKANGHIGIIPYIYKQASQYYYTLYLAQMANQTKDISQYKPKVKELIIPIPRVQEKPKKLLFEDGEE